MTFLTSYLEQNQESQRSSAAIAYLASLDHLRHCSPTVAQSIEKELKDQRSHLKLIASENFSSLAVQLAMGNLLTDKYAEGYVEHRFYAGCDNVDSVEGEANRLLCELYGCDHAYVQPHSGADANLVAFWAILTHKVQDPAIEKLGKKKVDELSPEEYEQLRLALVSQRLLGMSLNSGGHLTHGYRHNVSSKFFQSFFYDVDRDTGLLDYEALAIQAREVRPTILLAGYSAYPRKIDFSKMRAIADEVGATLMVDMAHFSGLVAGGVFTGVYNPIPYADVVTSTSHKTLRGPRGGFVLCRGEYAEAVDKGCPMILGGPLPHVMAAKAVAFREASHSDFNIYAQQVVRNAQVLADEFQIQGEKVLTGGTDNHMVLLNTSRLGITGRQAEQALRDAHINVNRNAIPFDPNGPWYTSGIRIGTPALTTLGMKEDEMRSIARIIVDVLKHTCPTTAASSGQPSKAKYILDDEVEESAKNGVEELLSAFPLYPEIQL